MRVLSASASIQFPHQLSSPLRKQAFSITTTRKERTFFPQQPLSLLVVNSADESSSFRVVPLAAAAVDKLRTDEKEHEEEVKSLLTLFLKELSLKDTMEFCKSVHFIDNLVSKLRNIHIIEFPVGRELTQVEIRNSLIPSIESLVEENRNILVKREKLPIPHQTINNSSLDSIKPNAKVVRVSSSNIQQPVGAFDKDCLKENESFIEFILQLGVLQSNIPMIIQTCPELLKTSIHDAKSTVDYLHEMGLSKEDICKIINIYPNILRLSIDDKLRLTAEYFRSKGIDPCVLLLRRPRIWDRSLEHDLKPVTEFFLERGFSVDDIVSLVLKLPKIYTFNVPKKLIPKWDFFLTLDYPRSEVIMFPHYFGYSLEARIKPRYARLREIGLELSLNAVLVPSDDDFEKIVNGEVKKTRYRQGF